MTKEELRAMILEEIGNIAPEAEGIPIGDEEDLREALDLDSMDIFNIVVALSQRLGIDIPEAEVGELVTIGGGVAYLERQLAKRTAS